MLNINPVDLVSWIFTILTTVLYFLERKKNRPYYMAMEGISKALTQKVGFYASKLTEVKGRDRKAVPKNEYTLLIEVTYADYRSLKELVEGVMNAIEPNKKIVKTENKATEKNMS